MSSTTDNCSTEKKIRFRPPAKVLFKQDSKIEDLFRNDNEMSEHAAKKECKSTKYTSLLSFLEVEVTRDYVLEHDEERYSARREKIYSFMKIPKEVERFMRYGFLQCSDSFLFVYTFLPIRVILAIWALITRPFSKCFGFGDKKNKRILTPAEICDLLKAVIIFVGTIAMLSVDTNILYHMVKSQSVIKLYIFYNMLEIGDRMFSAFGQDTIDSLFWTATEPRGKKREHLGVIPHLLFAIVYVVLHGILILFQATTLNVAVNSKNKALLTIMMSNNFLELKGSVFKKFDKYNLFQVSCSDVRERFHLCFLLFIVVLQTMREYSWKYERFLILLPDCIGILLAELLVDWVKHAFITRFNELQLDVYRDYTTSLAYDVSQTKQKHAFSDHSDMVARRMGFVPLPLGVVMIRVLIHSVQVENVPAVAVFLVAYAGIGCLKVLTSIVVLGKACALIAAHKEAKSTQSPTNRSDSPLPNVKSKEVATSPSHPVTEQPRPVFANGIDERLPQLDMAAPIFANSTVDLKNVSLNEELLKVDGDELKLEESTVTRSYPEIKCEYEGEEVREEGVKRAESEPNLNKMEND